MAELVSQRKLKMLGPYGCAINGNLATTKSILTQNALS